MILFSSINHLHSFDGSSFLAFKVILLRSVIETKVMFLDENIGVYTSSKKPTTSHVPNQSKLKQFNSPLSQFIQKHKEYRLKKAQQKDSVELSDLYRDSSLSSNPFTQTVVVHPHDNLFPKEIPFSGSKVVKKPKTKRRAKYLTNKAKLTKIPSQ